MNPILNVLKSCDAYFEMLLESKQSSEWKKAIQCMKENKELEMSLKKRALLENDTENIFWIINTFYCDYRMSQDIYTIKFLLDLIEIFYNQNEHSIKVIKTNKYLINFIILIFIKAIQVLNMEPLTKFKEFLFVYQRYINSQYLKELLRSASLEKIQMDPIEEIKTTATSNLLGNYLDNDPLSLPSSWKTTER